MKDKIAEKVVMPAKAEESQQIKKARKKLEQQLLKESKKINEKALKQMKRTIQAWIQRHSAERIKLQERFELFDENKHSVKVKSKFVQHLMDQLKDEMKKTQKPLTGRIKP